MNIRDNCCRILSYFLIICMIVCYMPISSGAYVYAEEDNYVNGNVLVRYADIENEHFNKSLTAVYKDDYFIRDNSTYDIELAELSIYTSMASRTVYYNGDNTAKVGSSERDTNIKEFLTGQLGFTDYEAHRYSKDLNDTSDLAAYSFSHKKVNINGSITDIVSISVRSGLYDGEWKSNGNVTGSDFKDQHNGFSKAAADVYDSFKEYVKEYDLDISKIKVWISGYSRGAAIANIVGADLIRCGVIDDKNMYCYCAATPRTTKNPVEYRGIYNTLSPIDIVPKVPPAYWNYSWFGKVISLPDKINDIDYSSDQAAASDVFSKLTSGAIYGRYPNHYIASEALVSTLVSAVGGTEEKYEKLFQAQLSNVLCKYLGDTDVDIEYLTLLHNLGITNGYAILLTGGLLSYGITEGALSDLEQGIRSKLIIQHWPEVYLSYLKTGKIFEGIGSKMVSVNCPSNVRVYDEDNKLVADIEGENYTDFIKNNRKRTLEMYVDNNGVKKVYLPEAGDYTLEIEATKDGKLSYSIDEIGEDGITEEKINYSDIKVSQGDVINAEISEGNDIEESLYNPVINEEEEIKPSDVLSGDSLGTISVNCEVIGDGIVSGAGNYTKGDSISLTAIAIDGAQFAGWYIGNDLVSEETSYGFIAEENIDITAKFVPEITADNCSLSYTERAYSIKDSKPVVTVKAGDKALIKNEDYQVICDEDTSDVGTYDITVIGIGDYGGTASLSFKVNPVGTRIKTIKASKKGFKVKWNKQNMKMSVDRIDGYQIKYSTSKDFKKCKTVSVKGFYKNSKKISNLKSKKYYVKLRTYKTVDGNKYYSSWSKVKQIKTK